VTLTLALPTLAPGSPYALELVPVPRVRPTVVSVDLDMGVARVERGPEALLVPTTLEPVKAAP
jgi:hypothetical protein